MEEWKIYPEFPTYEVSTYGQVRNKKRGNIIKQREDKDGYLVVNLSFEGKKYHRRVNRLIATAFIPNPDNLEIADHIDRNRKNNHVSNLRWVSITQNNRNKISNSKIDICDKYGNVIKSFDFYNRSRLNIIISQKMIKCAQLQQLIKKLEDMLNIPRIKYNYTY